jgi:hypothetical protein
VKTTHGDESGEAEAEAEEIGVDFEKKEELKRSEIVKVEVRCGAFTSEALALKRLAHLPTVQENFSTSIACQRAYVLSIQIQNNSII